MGEPSEYLIVVDPRHVGGLSALGGMVTQEASARLGVVRVDAATLAELRRRPDVVAVAERTLPDEVVDDLDDSERLFADAWAQHERPKRRPGEGRPWDADGFEPPDP